ncbi:MAG: hypothetical protein KGO81_08830 [Bacteroidota bacterium]|nr:hypothetical protein [Bacteroidota bacterium]
MKQLLFYMILMITASLAKAQTDTSGVNEKASFYKNYSNYILKSKEQTPKVTVDSLATDSLLRKPSSVKPSVSTTLRAREVKGIIVPKGKKAIVIKPAEKVSIADTQTPASKFIFDTSKHGEPKITIDSSVYYPTPESGKISPTIHTDLKSKQIYGLVEAEKKKGIVIAPEKQQETPVIKQEKTKVPDIITAQIVNRDPPKMKPTVNIIDSSIYLKNEPKKPGIIVHTELKGRNIYGTLLPDNKDGVLIVPIMPAKNFNSLTTIQPGKRNDIPAQPEEKKEVIVQKAIAKKVDDPLAGYSTPDMNINGAVDKMRTSSITNPDTVIAGQLYNDPLDAYTTPPVKSNLKAVTLPGNTEIQSKKGTPVVIEPMAVTSAGQLPEQQKNRQDNMSSYTTPNAGDSVPASSNNKGMVSSVTPYSFYVTQSGKFSIVFTTADFTLMIGQDGKINKLDIRNNGVVISVALENKATQIGNISLSYNSKGWLDVIGNTPLSYTYDGKVNMVGNTNLSYNYEGNTDRVGNTFILYNGNDTVYKFGNYTVGYGNDGTVIGVDDNNGMVIFKPVI